MPLTFVTFGLGYLAIIGVPPFAGFYSKDKIIETALNHEGSAGLIFGSLALIGAAITAFYMSRVMLMTFFGNERWTNRADEPHEAPFLMAAPMVVLALGSICTGFLFTRGESLVNWLRPVVNPAGEQHLVEHYSATSISIAAITAVLIGVAFASIKYLKQVPNIAPDNVSVFTKFARKDLLQDEFNNAVLVKPGQSLVKTLLNFDYIVIDGLVRLVGTLSLDAGQTLRKLQTGYVRSYALLMILGVTALIFTIWLVTL
jgi:NADH-quinone oxidoreductase subunit L